LPEEDFLHIKHVLPHSWEGFVVEVSVSQRVGGGRGRFLFPFLTQTLPSPRLCAGEQILPQAKRQN